MTRFTATLTLLLTLAAGCAPDGGGLLGAQVPDYTGTWSGEVTTDGRALPLEAVLVQDRDELAGTVVLTKGFVWTFDVWGTVHGDEVTLSGRNVSGDSTIALDLLELEGALEGDWSMVEVNQDYGAEQEDIYDHEGEALLLPAVDAAGEGSQAL